MLATTILFTLADRSNSSFLAATVMGVEMAVGVIDAIAVFGVLAVAVAIAPLTIAAAADAAAAATDLAAVVVVVIFGFFLIDLPNYRSINRRSQCQHFQSYQVVDGVCAFVCVCARVCVMMIFGLSKDLNVFVYTYMYACGWVCVCVYL